MNQALLRLNLPRGKTLYASKFKELVARACHGNALVPASFFHFHNGQPISNAEPDIRFVGGREWVGILSRSGDTNALLPVAGIAMKVVGTHIGQPVPMELLQPKYGVEATQYPIRYYFRDVVSKQELQKKGSNEDLVIRMLCDQLRRERDRLFLDLPTINPANYQREDGTLLPREHGTAERDLLRERYGIEIHDIRSVGMPLETSTGLTKQFVRLLSGSLTMYLKTQGLWQFGSLQSRGYGRLIPHQGAN